MGLYRCATWKSRHWRYAIEMGRSRACVCGNSHRWTGTIQRRITKRRKGRKKGRVHPRWGWGCVGFCVFVLPPTLLFAVLARFLEWKVGSCAPRAGLWFVENTMPQRPLQVRLICIRGCPRASWCRTFCAPPATRERYISTIHLQNISWRIY